MKALLCSALLGICALGSPSEDDDQLSNLQIREATGILPERNRERQHNFVGTMGDDMNAWDDSDSSFGAKVSFDTINWRKTNIMPVLRVSIGGSRPMALLVDTGSSSMAFCDSNLDDLAIKSGAKKLDLHWCQHYYPGGAVGYVYNGSMTVEEFPEVGGVTYSVMNQKYSMPCGGGLDGIVGTAFKRLNSFTKTDGEIEPWDMQSVQKQNWAPNCPPPDASLPVNIWEFLRTKQHKTKKRLGIYWNGEVGENTGTFYLDDKALDNPHYDADLAEKIKLDDYAWMSFNALKLVGEGKEYNLTGFCGWTENGVWNSKPLCILDTGTPIITIPGRAWPWSGQPNGDFQLVVEGTDGPVTLTLDAGELYYKGFLQRGAELMFGIPFWKYYYTVTNMDDSWVRVVPLNGQQPLFNRAPPKFMGVVTQPRTVAEKDRYVHPGVHIWQHIRSQNMHKSEDDA